MSAQGVTLSKRLSIASAVTTATADVRPAVANALWPRLRARAWVRAMRPAAMTPIGNGPSIRTTTPPVPGPEARWESVTELEVLYAFTTRARSRLGRGLRVMLYREDHDRVLRDVDALQRREYRLALELATCERPFYRDPNQASGWRRNYKDSYFTERAAAVLQLLASVSHVEFMDPAFEDALLS